jgi:hypothetical protein
MPDNSVSHQGFWAAKVIFTCKEKEGQGSGIKQDDRTLKENSFMFITSTVISMFISIQASTYLRLPNL